MKHYSHIQEIFKEFEVSDSMPAPEQLKDAFNRRYRKVVAPEPEQRILSLMDVFDEFVKDCGMQNNWTDATYEKFAATRKHLQGFDSELTFDALDETRLSDYVNYLRDTKNLRNSTIGKQMGFLGWFLRWSKRKGYNNNNAFETFKPKLKTTQKKVIFLTWEELNKLREYPIPETKKYLERVRDVFLFCCFTGLRYSDVFNLKRSDVKAGHIEVTTVKTADSLIIELNNHSKAILDKYKNIPFANDKVLPVITNQKMNDYLKRAWRAIRYR
ncbi:Tyrosine recombinase XerC [termite gut metagenome]|uniref:Tyrosine recombinase XerC n=1 Tax=termite gut metagenome TaxID=433724 RepID=A0A5J4S4V9_9ZZZZ